MKGDSRKFSAELTGKVSAVKMTIATVLIILIRQNQQKQNAQFVKKGIILPNVSSEIGDYSPSLTQGRKCRTQNDDS